MKVTIENEGADHEILQIDNEAGEIWCIPFSAIASWGQLLGLTDHAEIVEAIMNYRDDGQEWAPLYEALEENLDELAKAGVPAEYMPDLVDPEMPSPIPGPKAQKRLVDRRKAAQGRVRRKFRKDAPKLSEFRQSLEPVLDRRREKIRKRTEEFMDRHSPTYLIEVAPELPVLPQPAAAPLPGDVNDLQIHLTQIDPSTI